MRNRLAALGLLPVIALVAAAALDTAPAPTRDTRTDPDGLVVHEWGTFTSIAGATGDGMEWLPQTGPSDLPCFVRRIKTNVKGLLFGTVRMETPVLYFYSPTATTVNVNVRFPQGAITEWYPQAAVTPAAVDEQKFSRSDFQGTISWPAVQVMPGAAESFPIEPNANHYYAARATDAVPVRVEDQTEKFLFYRGVGRFPPPLTATFASDGHLDVKSRTSRDLGDLVLFDNRGGTITFQITSSSGRQVAFKAVSPTGDLPSLYASLEQILVRSGLYQKEAAAMVATWRDSWFEEGTRIFYIAPRPVVDAILPLEISPQPKSIARVFVGRVEVFSPALLEQMRADIAARNYTTIKKYGRFFRAIGDRLRAETKPEALAAFDDKLSMAYGSIAWTSSACR
jgi:hypothetical protein